MQIFKWFGKGILYFLKLDKLINDLENIGVNKKDLNFAFFGLDCEKKNGKIVTKFNPFIITGTQFIELQENESDTPLIRRMKLENYARIFTAFKGRSGGADWLNTVDESQLVEIDEQVQYE